MENLDFKEKLWGGIFGAVAILAAITELFCGGINAASIAATIKDIFGTLVVIIVFIAVIKEKLPKSMMLHEKIKLAVEEWQNDNSNMIVRKPKNDKLVDSIETYSLDMKTNVKDFYTQTGATHNTGLFVRMPQFTEENYKTGNVNLHFYLNKGTFFAGDPDDESLIKLFYEYANRFTTIVNEKHGRFASANAVNPKEILVTISNPESNLIIDDEYVDNFMDVLNTMYTAYLVSARISK